MADGIPQSGMDFGYMPQPPVAAYDYSSAFNNTQSILAFQQSASQQTMMIAQQRMMQMMQASLQGSLQAAGAVFTNVTKVGQTMSEKAHERVYQDVNFGNGRFALERSWGRDIAWETGIAQTGIGRALQIGGRKPEWLDQQEYAHQMGRSIHLRKQEIADQGIAAGVNIGTGLVGMAFGGPIGLAVGMGLGYAGEKFTDSYLARRRHARDIAEFGETQDFSLRAGQRRMTYGAAESLGYKFAEHDIDWKQHIPLIGDRFKPDMEYSKLFKDMQKNGMLRDVNLNDIDEIEKKVKQTAEAVRKFAGLAKVTYEEALQIKATFNEMGLNDNNQASAMSKLVKTSYSTGMPIQQVLSMQTQLGQMGFQNGYAPEAAMHSGMSTLQQMTMLKEHGFINRMTNVPQVTVQREQVKQAANDTSVGLVSSLGGLKPANDWLAMIGGLDAPKGKEDTQEYKDAVERGFVQWKNKAWDNKTDPGRTFARGVKYIYDDYLKTNPNKSHKDAMVFTANYYGTNFGKDSYRQVEELLSGKNDLMDYNAQMAIATKYMTDRGNTPGVFSLGEGDSLTAKFDLMNPKFANNARREKLTKLSDMVSGSNYITKENFKEEYKLMQKFKKSDEYGSTVNIMNRLVRLAQFSSKDSNQSFAAREKELDSAVRDYLTKNSPDGNPPTEEAIARFKATLFTDYEKKAGDSSIKSQLAKEQLMHGDVGNYLKDRQKGTSEEEYEQQKKTLKEAGLDTPEKSLKFLQILEHGNIATSLRDRLKKSKEFQKEAGLREDQITSEFVNEAIANKGYGYGNMNVSDSARVAWHREFAGNMEDVLKEAGFDTKSFRFSNPGLEELKQSAINQLSKDKNFVKQTTAQRFNVYALSRWKELGNEGKPGFEKFKEGLQQKFEGLKEPARALRGYADIDQHIRVLQDKQSSDKSKEEAEKKIRTILGSLYPEAEVEKRVQEIKSGKDMPEYGMQLMSHGKVQALYQEFGKNLAGAYTGSATEGTIKQMFERGIMPASMISNITGLTNEKGNVTAVFGDTKEAASIAEKTEQKQDSDNQKQIMITLESMNKAFTLIADKLKK